MVSPMSFIRDRLQQMPYWLRIVSRVFLTFAFVFPVFALLIAVFGKSNLAGKEVSQNNFFDALLILLMGIFFGVLVYGFVHATRWVRPLCFLLVLTPYLDALADHLSLIHIRMLFYLNSAAWLALVTWYLYFYQPVKDYFALSQKPAIRDAED